MTKLRWGYSTGACAAALAVGAWRLLHKDAVQRVCLLFPDGERRELPLLPPEEGWVSLRKDGGDDPDCTHGARLYARLRPCFGAPGEAPQPEDYCLQVGAGMVFVRAVEGIGLCTRRGLDCEQGKWAINTVPRRMIAENLAAAGLCSGDWLLELGVENGQELAKHTLNPQLGIVGGLSLLGTTGLVRPYSHEAYIETVRICVRSHALAGGKSMVFCTGGRTQAGARRRLPGRSETGFVCIGDFIAESLAAACRYGMQEVTVACMAGKLCKYAAGFTNTHAHKVSQDMALLRAEVRRLFPEATALHQALAQSVTVREALLSLSEVNRPELLQRLAREALSQFARHCTAFLTTEIAQEPSAQRREGFVFAPGSEGASVAVPQLRLMVFDFSGTFLFEEKA